MVALHLHVVADYIRLDDNSCIAQHSGVDRHNPGVRGQEHSQIEPKFSQNASCGSIGKISAR